MKGQAALWTAIQLWRVLAVSGEAGVKRRGQLQGGACGC
jgi:hypothetical protein